VETKILVKEKFENWFNVERFFSRLWCEKFNPFLKSSRSKHIDTLSSIPSVIPFNHTDKMESK